MATDSELDGDAKRPFWITGRGVLIIFAGVLLGTLLIGSLPWFITKKAGSEAENAVGSGSAPRLLVREDAGLWGDSFGFVNAIASGLAFAGVIVTLMMQSHELAIQRRELTRSRIQYEGMARAQAESSVQALTTSYLNSISLLNTLNNAEVLRDCPRTAEEAASAVLLLRLHDSMVRLLPAIEHQLSSKYEVPQRAQNPDIVLMTHLAEGGRSIELLVRLRGGSSAPEAIAEAKREVAAFARWFAAISNSIRPSLQSAIDDINKAIRKVESFDHGPAGEKEIKAFWGDVANLSKWIVGAAFRLFHEVR